MPRREPDPEPMDEQVTESELPTVGEQLRAAREKKKMSLEDIAAQTRIPQRHLESLERSNWESLPAPTYTTGFAKSYASAVGLDRTEIGDQLRAEMGGQRFSADTAQVFEAADPARTMPKWLVLSAIGAVIILVAVMSWLNSRSLEQQDESNNAPAAQAAPAAETTSAPAAKPVQQAASAAQGHVVLTAIDAVWLQVSDKGGAILFSATLQPGQTYAVPATAAAPMLKTGKPEALRISVGNAIAPPLGPPAKKVTASLLPADLMKGPAAAAPQAPARTARGSSQPLPPSTAAEPVPTTNAAQ